MRAARKHLDSPYWRFLLLLSCALVFSFAFHAKVAVYHNPTHIDASTSSKLWLNGGRMESASLAPGPLLLPFAFLLFLFQPTLPRRLPVLRPAPVSSRRKQHSLYWFLRPPPGL